MRSLSKNMRCHKNRYCHNFQNFGSKLNQRLLLVYEPMLIRFGSYILKIATVFVFGTPHLQFFSNEGQLRPPVIRPKTPSTPLCHTYSGPPGCEDSPGGIQNIPYGYKKLSKSRLSDPFFLLFLVISEVGSQIYIANLAIFKI